jgi:hypothetical protein
MRVSVLLRNIFYLRRGGIAQSSYAQRFGDAPPNSWDVNMVGITGPAVVISYDHD